MSARCAVGSLAVGLVVLLAFAACGEEHVHHPPRFPGGAVEPTEEGLSVEIGGTEVLEDHECLVCHGLRDEEDDDEDQAPYVDGHGYLATAHARKDVACELCHEEHEDYPHPKDAEQLTVQCGDCHDDKLEAEGDDVHVRLEGMDPEEPSTTQACIGCHRAHTLRMACAGCHDAKWETNFERRDLDPPHDDLVFHHGEQNRWCLDCHDATLQELGSNGFDFRTSAWGPAGGYPEGFDVSGANGPVSYEQGVF